MVELRPYQTEAIQAVRDRYAQGDRATLLVMATGTGKTSVFSDIARRTVDNGGHVLMLAHREELINQAAERVSLMCGYEAGIEKAERRYDYESPICVASVQSLQGGRLDALRKGWFNLTIVDEAHHSVAPTYRNIIDHVGGYLLGVTATADRADRQGLAQVYDSIAYEYPLARAVSEGYLAPIKAKCIPLKMDLRGVKVSHGDYQAADLGSALDPYLEDIAKVMATECAYRKTVCFLPLVSTAEKMADALNAAGLRAVCVSGYDSSDVRRGKLDAFERGEYDVMTNALLLTEGWDCPSVDCIVMLRPTKSRSMYAQAVGRGTRLSPETGKKELLLLDFLWMTEKHDLCRPASLLGKEEQVSARMTEILEDGGGCEDLMELAEHAETDVVRQREDALAKELARMRKKKGKLVDPLQFAMSIQDLNLLDYQPAFAWQCDRPTDKQLAAIEKFGVASDGVDSKGQAQVLLDALCKRADFGLSTAKQIRKLESYGFTHVGTWSKDQASRMMARIAANRWMVPRGIIPAAYVPEG